MWSARQKGDRGGEVGDGAFTPRNCTPSGRPSMKARMSCSVRSVGSPLIEIGHVRWADHRRACGACGRLYQNIWRCRAKRSWWLVSVLGLRLELERPNSSPKPSHADSLTLKSAARVVLGRSVNGELTENESCAFIGGGYAVNRTRGVRNNG